MCVCVCDGIPEGCWFVLAAREREIYYAYAVRAKGEETFAYIYTNTNGGHRAGMFSGTKEGNYYKG